MLHYYKEQGGDEMLKRKAYDKLSDWKKQKNKNVSMVRFCFIRRRRYGKNQSISL